MSDNEMKFKDKAKLFTESYLSVLKEHAFFFEGEEGDENDEPEDSREEDEKERDEDYFKSRQREKDEISAAAKKKRPQRDLEVASKKKSREEDSSKEKEVLGHKPAKRSPNPITKSRKKQAKKGEKSPGAFVKKNPSEEIKGVLAARKDGGKPVDSSDSRVKKLGTPEDIEQKMASWKEREAEKKQRKVPSSPEKMVDKVMAPIPRPQGKTQTLGRTIHRKSLDDLILPYITALIGDYVEIKKALVASGHDPSTPQSTPQDSIFNVIENIFKLPPFVPGDKASVNAFQNAYTALRTDPTKTIPAAFFQSSLRSYPRDLTSNVEDHLKNIGWSDATGQTSDKHKILNILLQHDENGKKTPALKLGQFVKLLNYFKENPKEIDAAERTWKTSLVGSPGMKGETSGVDDAVDFHGEGDADNISDEDLDLSSDQEEEQLDDISPSEEPIEQDNSSFEDKLDRYAEEKEDSGGFNAGSLLKQAISGEKKPEPVYDFLKSKNAYDNIFNDYQDVSNFKTGSKISPSDLTNKASKFLEAVFGRDEHNPIGDVNLQRHIIAGISRQYVYSLFSKEAKEEAEKIVKIENDSLREELFSEMKKKFNSKTFTKMSRDARPVVKEVIGKMLNLHGGKVTLRDPKRIDFSWQNKAIAEFVYAALSPTRLAEKKPFSEFLVSKAESVDNKITEIINSVERGEEEIRQNRIKARDAAMERGRPASPEAGEILAQKREKDEATKSLPQEERDRIRQVRRVAGKLPGTTTTVFNKPEGGKRVPILGVDPKFAEPPSIKGNVKDEDDAERAKKVADLVAKGLPIPDYDKKASEKKGVKKKAVSQKQLVKSKTPEEQRAADLMAKNLEFRKQNKKPIPESLMLNISNFFISEGFELNSKNVSKYLVSLCRSGKISKESLEEMLLDLYGKKVDDVEEQNWENAKNGTSSKRKTKLRG